MDRQKAWTLLYEQTAGSSQEAAINQWKVLLHLIKFMQTDLSKSPSLKRFPIQLF